MERSRSHLSVRQLVVVGMLSGITIFMGLTGLGFIPIPPVKATIMGVPVIIGALIEGPMVGALVGLVFGIFSIYQAISAPVLTSFMFYNPIIAIVPRVLIGVIAYLVYKALKNKFKKDGIPIVISAVVGSFVNTVGVLGLTYLIYLDKYAHTFGISVNAAKGAIALVGVTNGIPEAIVCALITLPVVLTMNKIKKKR
ncbi:ECF transporter S component [Clostridium thermobutyricum]|uniref:ECF transporter S component n=1 Tax=Clostridium thermobutyricum TaxID=29372 RepID=UPI0018A9426F|nr:ECF transporter S component [Clostridium thermobutyricum]